MGAGGSPVRGSEREEESGAGALEETGERLLPPLEIASGLTVAVLVDRAGRLVESRGLEDPSCLRQAASLVAAMHATGARLSEASGDPGRAWITMGAGSQTLLLIPLPRPGTLILLLVMEGGDTGPARTFVESLVVRIREEPPLPAMAVDDPREFEATLERSLEVLDGRSSPANPPSDGDPPVEGR